MSEEAEVQFIARVPATMMRLLGSQRYLTTMCSPTETRRFLADAQHHLVLGYVHDRLAGFVSGVEIFHPDKRSELFLNEIAIIKAARRGVGRALIEELQRVGRERGCGSMWVLTDE